jgi:hypothetical protein
MVSASHPYWLDDYDIWWTAPVTKLLLLLLPSQFPILYPLSCSSVPTARVLPLGKITFHSHIIKQVHYSCVHCNVYVSALILTWMAANIHKTQFAVTFFMNGQPWGPPSLPYIKYQDFPRGGAAGAWHWPPAQSNSEVNKRVEMNFILSISMHWWHYFMQKFN